MLATRPGSDRTGLETWEDRTDQGHQSPPQLAEAGQGATSRQLPGPASTRRLPAGDGRLRVEQTPERLTLSDPDEEEAYLSSTVWVDVEE